MKRPDIKIEICLDSVESVIQAEQGGADRVEFCSDLFEGGLTPTLGAFKVAQSRTNITKNVMIRPRGGDFCYSDLEFEAMIHDARIFTEAGADALVFGILTPEGTVDKKRCRILLEEVRPPETTFHRAFDMTRDPYQAMRDLIELGFTRVLTSGLEPSVPEGMDLLADLIKEFGRDIIIMPGAGINERNFERIHSFLNASEYHMMLHEESEGAMTYRPSHIFMGGMLRQPEFTCQHTSRERVSSAVSAIGKR